MISRFFTFPNPVNDLAARTVASGVVLMAALAAATPWTWLTVPLAYGFIARVLAGPRLSPLGRFAVSVVAPKLPFRARLVPGPPKRFAQGIGAAVSSAALILWALNETAPARVVLGCLCVPALMEATCGYCVGCSLFALLIRTGLVPESVCRDCSDIWSRPGIPPRP